MGQRRKQKDDDDDENTDDDDEKEWVVDIVSVEYNTRIAVWTLVISPMAAHTIQATAAAAATVAYSFAWRTVELTRG